MFVAEKTKPQRAHSCAMFQRAGQSMWWCGLVCVCVCGFVRYIYFAARPTLARSAVLAVCCGLNLFVCTAVCVGTAGAIKQLPAHKRSLALTTCPRYCCTRFQVSAVILIRWFYIRFKAYVCRQSVYVACIPPCTAFFTSRFFFFPHVFVMFSCLRVQQYQISEHPLCCSRYNSFGSCSRYEILQTAARLLLP